MSASGIFSLGPFEGSSKESSDLHPRVGEDYKPGCQLPESRVWGGSEEPTIPRADFSLNSPVFSLYSCLSSLSFTVVLLSFLSSISLKNKPPVSQSSKKAVA